MQPNLHSKIAKQLAEETGLPVEDISYDDDLIAFNLDSLALLTLAHELELEVGFEIDPAVFTEFNTINRLTEWISRQQ